MWPISIALKTSSVPFRSGTRFAEFDGAQVGPLIDFDVALDIDAANVMVIFVRAGRHVAATFETDVGDDT
jgi:hypothetical protein